jgi:hypothetical protein
VYIYDNTDLTNFRNIIIKLFNGKLFLKHTFSLDVALDAEIDVTRPFTGEYFFQEAKGLADATGLDYKVKVSDVILEHY